MTTSEATSEERRRAAAKSGHTGDEATARALLRDSSATVRATALGALVRMEAATLSDVVRGLADPDTGVRRRACQIGGTLSVVPPSALVDALDDVDATVVEMAAWSLGEKGSGGVEAVERLSAIATSHEEALCREAAIAALGAIGDERGLAAILAGTHDRATVRRRAVIALVPFAGAEVDAALRRALDDKDWQVRQAAEDLS